MCLLLNININTITWNRYISLEVFHPILLVKDYHAPISFICVQIAHISGNVYHAINAERLVTIATSNK